MKSFMQYPRHLILDTKFSRATATSPQQWSSLYTHKLLKSPDTSSKLNTYNTPVQWKTSKNPLASNTLTPIEHFPHHLFNINFLRKERLYTKLKYSRCPQYDIVGGGWAALFAGLLGFLISEKFGIELVDSGDFYNALMYAIFASFALRPLIKIIDKSFQLKDLLLLPLLADYLLTLLTLLIKPISKIIRFN